MDKHIEVIGNDHGWSNMKTATQIFTTGVKEITTEPAFYDDVVELDGRYYKVGGKRLEVRDTKVENDNFYLLTLAAVAKELKQRGLKDADVLLSVGLVKNGIAEFTGIEQYLFDGEKMRGLCPDGMAAYEQVNGLDKKQERKEVSR